MFHMMWCNLCYQPKRSLEFDELTAVQASQRFYLNQNRYRVHDQHLVFIPWLDNLVRQRFFSIVYSQAMQASNHIGDIQTTNKT